MEISDILLRTGYGLIMGFVFVVLLQGQDDMLLHQIPEKRLYLFVIAVSFCLIGVASRYSVGIFWLLPLAVVGCLEAMEIKIVTFGMMMAVYLCNALMIHEQIQQMIYYLVMGTALLMILSMLRRRQEIPYAGVILLALCLALLVLQNSFDLKQMWQSRYEILLEISSLLFLILFTASLQLHRGHGDAALLRVLSDDFELLKLLKEKKDLYHHCCDISTLSYLAAKEIDCDSILARAGGMYHEVGRLKGEENYLEANMELVAQYQFPDRLVNVIRQHNTGSEIPKSPEAAIVMLSDCIISTGEYLKKSGKRDAISDEKLVKSIFSNRIAKGSLGEAGLSQNQLEQLQEYYVKYAFVSREREYNL
jgi:hypothetical protein